MIIEPVLKAYARYREDRWT